MKIILGIILFIIGSLLLKITEDDIVRDIDELASTDEMDFSKKEEDEKKAKEK